MPRRIKKQVRDMKILQENMETTGKRGRPNKEAMVKNAILRITEDKLALNRMGVPLDTVLINATDLANYICAKTNNLQDVIDVLVEEFKKDGTGARTKCDIANLLVNRVVGPANKPMFEAGVSSDGQIVVRWGGSNETSERIPDCNSEEQQC
jgi:hypothetical protein